MAESELRRSDLAADPLEQFAVWFAEAGDAVETPEAMALATSAANGSPSLRMVLLKRFDERGLVFHTHYTSRKGRELEANPRAADTDSWTVLDDRVPPPGRGCTTRNLFPMEQDAARV